MRSKLPMMMALQGRVEEQAEESRIDKVALKMELALLQPRNTSARTRHD